MQNISTTLTALHEAEKTIPPEESFIEYPTHFPIKVMGLHTDHFVNTIVELVRGFDKNFDAASVELRPSSGGKYLGLTVSPYVTNREELDNIYRALTSHELVKYVL